MKHLRRFNESSSNDNNYDCSAIVDLSHVVNYLLEDLEDIDGIDISNRKNMQKCIDLFKKDFMKDLNVDFSNVDLDGELKDQYENLVDDKYLKKIAKRCFTR